MFSRFRSQARPPRWGFRAGWEDFVEEVRAQLGRRGITLDDLGDGIVQLPQGSKHATWELRSIASRCHTLEPSLWEQVIRDSLDAALGQPQPARYERSQLRIQLLESVAAGAVTRTFGDLELVLTAEVHGMDRVLATSELEQLGLTPDEAFALARDNAAKELAGKLLVSPRQLGDVPYLVFASRGSFLTGAMIDRHERSPNGAIVVPGTTTWLHMELGPKVTRDTLDELADLVELALTQAPGSLFPMLWWWPAGEPPTAIDLDGELPPDLAAKLAS